MIDLLMDTNVLIHMLHPTGNAEAGLTRQLLDWDRVGYLALRVSVASGHEQSRTLGQLAAELETLGLAFDRIVRLFDVSPLPETVNQINKVLNRNKPADRYDALIVYTALAWAQQGHDTLLVTGDRNILRHAEQLQALGAPRIMNLRGAVNHFKANFPLTIEKKFGVLGSKSVMV